MRRDETRRGTCHSFSPSSYNKKFAEIVEWKKSTAFMPRNAHQAGLICQSALTNRVQVEMDTANEHMSYLYG